MIATRMQVLLQILTCLYTDLLPLHGSTGEWGSGTILVTTNNVQVIPFRHTTAASTIIVDPLSIEESTKLIEETAGYSLSSTEKTLLEATAEKKHWRLIPLVMARYEKPYTLSCMCVMPKRRYIIVLCDFPPIKWRTTINFFLSQESDFNYS